jgi:hypothetical protein
VRDAFELFDTSKAGTLSVYEVKASVLRSPAPIALLLALLEHIVPRTYFASSTDYLFASDVHHR